MRINTIKENDVVNGEGVMVSVWVQGCPHRCKGCHNPETWDFKGEIVKSSEKLYEEIKSYLDKDGIERNLSILGGEPLCHSNIVGVWSILRRFKNDFPDRKVYLWTGYTMEQFGDFQNNILPYVDYLIDGKYEEDKKDLSLFLRGSSNQRVIDVKETLRTKSIKLHSKC
ncbi:anaerobic ribonucleoside-triphosphate reductase activating protein [Paraclostridium bifermentans]